MGLAEIEEYEVTMTNQRNVSSNVNAVDEPTRGWLGVRILK